MNLSQSCRLVPRQLLSQRRNYVTLRLTTKINYHRTVKVLLEVLVNKVDVLLSRLHHVNRRHSVQLLPIVLYMKVQSYIALAKVLHLEQSSIDLPVKTIENNHLPQILPLPIDLLQQSSLLGYQIDLNTLLLHHSTCYLITTINSQKEH